MIRLFRVFVPTSVLVLLVSESILIFFSYIAAAFIVFDQIDPEVFFFYDAGFQRIGIVAAIIMFGLYFNDLYGQLRVRSRTLLIQQLCLSLGVAFLAQAVLGYANRDFILPKWLMIYGSAITIIALFLWRVAYSSVVQAAAGAEKVLFIGSSPVMFETAKHIKFHPELGMSVLGYLDEECAAAEVDGGHTKRLGCIGDLSSIVSGTRPGRIVVGMRERRRPLPVNELLKLRFAGIMTEEMAHLYEATFGRVCAREIRPSHLIFSRDLGPRPHQVQIQTLYSTFIASYRHRGGAPLIAITALLVRFSSPGPVLFRQKRVGLHDQAFTLYQVPVDVCGRRGPHRRRLGHRKTTPASRRSAAGCGFSGWTNCPSSSMFCVGRCRSWVLARNVPNSSRP